MGVFHRQPPVWSPIPASALPKLIVQSARLAADPRPELRSLLLERYGFAGCLLSASGTHALQIALSTLTKEAEGSSPVLLPAFTCYEVATAAVGARARVALYDIDPLTLEPDWESVMIAGRSGAAALVVAPLFGMPINWDIARRMADDFGAPLVADVAQAHGATWQDAPAGYVADVVVLSFGRGKGWTGAGGGALLWRGSARLDAFEGQPAWTMEAAPMRAEASTAGAATSQFLLGRSAFYGLPAAIPFLRLGETVYHEPTPTRPISRSSAALLLANDEVSLREVLHRRSNAEQYTRWLGQTGTKITAVSGARLDVSSGALRYPLRVKGGWGAVQATAAPLLGAAPTYPTTLHDLPALKPWLDSGSQSVPGARLLVRELVTLPTHSQTTEQERQRLVELLRE